MSYTDLRQFLEEIDRLGELEKIEGADCELEIGALTELAAETRGPALLFDNIKHFPSGYRIVSNLFFGNRRLLSAMDFPLSANESDAIKLWKIRLKQIQPVPPVMIDSGPIFQNTVMGSEIDVRKFPAPRWHEGDGGNYIGTGDIVIIRDRETGWVNVGVYRIMVHDRNTLGLFFQAVRHGFRLARKYWEHGEACPVAISLGQDPAIFLAAGVALGYVRDQVSEYDLAGYVRSKPVEVIPGKITNLPLPATAEVVLEGEIRPLDEQRIEGPFAEYTGYYGHKGLPSPVVNVKAIHFRDNPILIGAPPFKPAFGGQFSMSLGLAQTWNQLESCGINCISDIRRVCGISALVIAVEQKSDTDVPKLIRVLSEFQNLNLGSAGPFHKLAVIVDEDINLDDPNDIIWAIGTRCNPKTGLSVVTGESREELEPLAPQEQVGSRAPFEISRMILNACKPYSMRHQFPEVNVLSSEYRAVVLQKWANDLPFLASVK